MASSNSSDSTDLSLPEIALQALSSSSYQPDPPYQETGLFPCLTLRELLDGPPPPPQPEPKPKPTPETVLFKDPDTKPYPQAEFHPMYHRKLLQPEAGCAPRDPTIPDKSWFPDRGKTWSDEHDAEQEISKGKVAYKDAWTYAARTSPKIAPFMAILPIRTRTVDSTATGIRSRPHDASPPTGFDAVVVKDTKSRRGRGVYARVDLPKGHPVIVEEPMISCIHWRQRKGIKNVGEQWMKLTPKARSDLRNTFPKLLGIKSDKTLSSSGRKKLEQFIDEYAFWDGRRDWAHIYHLGSLINHACGSCANAYHWTDAEAPNLQTIRLSRDVVAGEELFIHYGKRNLSYGCGVCGSHKQSKLEDLSGTLHDVKKLTDSVLKSLHLHRTKTIDSDGTGSRSNDDSQPQTPVSLKPTETGVSADKGSVVSSVKEKSSKEGV